MDSQTKRRLVEIKRLYQYVDRMVRTQISSTVSRVTCIIMLDFIAESILKLTISLHPEYLSRRILTFPEVIKKVEEIINDKLKDNLDYFPMKMEINNLHNIRNNVMHHGSIPSIEDVEKFNSYVRTFLEEIFRGIFKLDFNELSLTFLINDPIIRELMKKSEKYLLDQKYENSIIHACIAFQEIIKLAKEDIFTSLSIYSPSLPDFFF